MTDYMHERTQKADDIVWQSKLLPELKLTKHILTLLRSRYPHVHSWQSLMLDLEQYLWLNLSKRPKNYDRFIFNCARRRADDVRKGFRNPDGTVNLKTWGTHRQKAPAQHTKEGRTAQPLSISEVLARAASEKPARRSGSAGGETKP